MRSVTARKEAARVVGFAVLLVAAAGAAQAIAGGTVTNVLPVTESFTNALGGTTTAGAVDTFAGVVRDNNGEEDIATLKVVTTSGPALTSTHTVLASEIAATAKPASFTGGWKVWNPSPGDGRLSWELQTSYVSTGTYVLVASVKDEGAEQPFATTVTVVVGDALFVAPDPVDATGTVLTGIRWGAWSATPGAANVAATNYLKVTNLGTLPDQAFTVDYSSAAFTGVTDSSKIIAVDSNIQFAWWEDTSPTSTAPNQGTFDFGLTSASGSVTPNFSAIGNVIYVTYRLVALPTPLMDQGYQATYTVTPVF